MVQVTDREEYIPFHKDIPCKDAWFIRFSEGILMVSCQECPFHDCTWSGLGKDLVKPEYVKNYLKKVKPVKIGTVRDDLKGKCKQEGRFNKRF